MLPIARPQRCAVQERGCRNQGITEFYSVALSILPKIFARLTARLGVYWRTRQRPKEVVKRVVLRGTRSGPEFRYAD